MPEDSWVGSPSLIEVVWLCAMAFVVGLFGMLGVEAAEWLVWRIVQ